MIAQHIVQSLFDSIYTSPVVCQSKHLTIKIDVLHLQSIQQIVKSIYFVLFFSLSSYFLTVMKNVIKVL